MNYKKLLTKLISGAVSGPSKTEQNTLYITKPDVGMLIFICVIISLL